MADPPRGGSPRPGAAPPAGEWARMLAGEPCLPGDPELSAMRGRALDLQERYNALPHRDADGRRALLGELLGSVGEGVVVRPNLRCDYGVHIHIGAGTFINFDPVFLDGAEIHLGTANWVGPRVQFITASHPVDADQRRAGWELHAPIHVGDDVWIGAGAILLPGVTVGAGAIIGAGAVVSRDVPAATVVAGVPARVLRTVGPADRLELAPRG